MTCLDKDIERFSALSVGGLFNETLLNNCLLDISIRITRYVVIAILLMDFNNVLCYNLLDVRVMSITRIIFESRGVCRIFVVLDLTLNVDCLGK